MRQGIWDVSSWNLLAGTMDGIQLDSDLVVDYADLVFCNDCMGAVKRLARSLEVDEATLALRGWYFFLERTSWDEEVQGLLTEVE